MFPMKSIRINTNSLVHLLEVAFKNFKDDPAYVCMDKELTYNDIDRMSLDFAPTFKMNVVWKKETE